MKTSIPAFTGAWLALVLAAFPLMAQRDDNPVYGQVTLTGTLYVPTAPVYWSSTTMTLTFVDQSGATVTSIKTNNGMGSTVEIPTRIANIFPHKNYTVSCSLTSVGATLGVGTITFAPPPGYTVVIDGVTKRTKTLSFGTSSFTFRIGVPTDYPDKDFEIDLPGGVATSISPDKPIWHVGLGRMRNGRPAGGLGFRRPDFSDPNFFKPATLFHEPPDAAEINVVRMGGVIRQVRSRDVLIDVPTPPVGAISYTINVYEPPDLPPPNGTGPSANPDGTWPVSGSPFCSYTISQVSDADGNGMRIERTEDGATFQTSLQMLQNSGTTTWTWRDWRKSGFPAFGSSCVRTVFTGTSSATVSHSGPSADDPAVTETPLVWTRTFTQHTWGKELNTVTFGAGGQTPLVTQYSYHTSTAGNGYPGFLNWKINPDGTWVRYEYYTSSGASGSAGMVSREYHPWLDTSPLAPASATTANSHYINWQYAVSEDGSRVLPATRASYAPGGTLLNLTSWDYSLNVGTLNGRTVARHIRKDWFNGQAHLTTTTKYHRQDCPDPYYRGKPVSIEYPDGRKDSYVYLAGTWSEAGRVFINDGKDRARAILCFHGQTEGGQTLSNWGADMDPLQMVPNRSTITETIIDEHGRVVLEAEYLFVASLNAVRISAVHHAYDAHGRPTESVDLIRASHDGATQLRSGRTYAGGLIDTITDEAGVVTRLQFDPLLRIIRSETGYGGSSPTPPKVTGTTFDGANRPVRVDACGCGSVETDIAYDTAGRVLLRIDEGPGGQDLTTSYSYPSVWQTTVTQPTGATTLTQPTGATTITDRYRDGRLKSVTGTAQAPSHHSYTVNETGSVKRRQVLTLDKSRSTAARRPSSSSQRRTNWLAEAASPMRNRSASHRLDTDVARFVAAARSTLPGSDFFGPSALRSTFAATANACRRSSQIAIRSCLTSEASRPPNRCRSRSAPRRAASRCCSFLKPLPPRHHPRLIRSLASSRCDGSSAARNSRYCP